MTSQLILPKNCPSDDYLLVAISSKYSNKKIQVTACDNNTLEVITENNEKLTQPAAIANYLLENTFLLADKTIDGPEFHKVETLIHEYVGLAGNIIKPNAALQTHPLFNARAPEKNKEIADSSKKALEAVIKDLNDHLFLNTFLAAERLTLADLAVASSLVLLYRS